jgi:hypothetical protein
MISNLLAAYFLVGLPGHPHRAAFVGMGPSFAGSLRVPFEVRRGGATQKEGTGSEGGWSRLAACQAAVAAEDPADLSTMWSGSKHLDPTLYESVFLAGLGMSASSGHPIARERHAVEGARVPRDGHHAAAQ